MLNRVEYYSVVIKFSEALGLYNWRRINVFLKEITFAILLHQLIMEKWTNK